MVFTEEDALKELLDCARMWQSFRDRPVPDIVAKIKSEVCEYEEENPNSLDALDELGDIVAGALRILVKLPDKQRLFVCKAAQLKAHRRVVSPRTKNKDVEASMREDIACSLGLIISNEE